MKNARSQRWKPDQESNLTAQEAEACLQQLAAISLGGLAPIAPVTTIRLRDQKEEPLSDPQGRMADGMYRTLLEQLPVVTFVAQLGQDASDIYVSPQIESLLGFTQQEWLEDPVLWYERLHPDDKARWNIEFSRFLTLDEPFQSTYRFLARDGRVVWVHGDVRIVRDAQGQPIYIQGTGYDVTELKEAEEALKRGHEQLERRVEERTDELAQANAALRAEVAERRRGEAALRRQAKELRRHQAEIQALNERLRRAMQEAHHRVKNNLQIIAALAEMQGLRGAVMVPIDELNRIGMHARTLAGVHDILTRHAKQGAQVDELPAREVLGHLISLLQKTAGNRRFDVRIEDASLSPRQGASLAIVTNELITNALKYGEGDIEIRFTVLEDNAILEVADNGPGFPDPFDPPAAARFGLDLVENAAQLDLQAEVRYDNRPQGGARVTITLPLNTTSILA